MPATGRMLRAIIRRIIIRTTIARVMSMQRDHLRQPIMLIRDRQSANRPL